MSGKIRTPHGHIEVDGSFTLTDTTLQGTTTFSTGKILIGDNPIAGTIATRGFVLGQINALVGSAPETLNTLKELSNSLGDVVNFKEYLDAQLVKKADGSSLSANDTAVNARASKLDVSMNLVTGRVTTLDTSMNLVTTRATTLDTSMNLVTGRVTTLDGSMNLVANQITLKANIASPTFTGTATFQAVTVGGASLSFTTLTDTTVLTLAGNYIVNANGNKIITLPASATAGNLITIYSPSYEYKLSANGASNATIAANAVTVCIYTSSSTWVAYASGVLVAFP